MTLKKLILKPLEIILVIGYLIFEEIIWNTFAQPIFTYLKNLAILDALKSTFTHMNRYLLVTIFLAILLLTEYMGVLSLLTIAQNQVALGMFIYGLKIPIATFTFWLFELTKPQLMTFGWLKAVYELIMRWIDRLVHSSIYQSVKNAVHKIKHKVQITIANLKATILFKAIYQTYTRIKKFFFN